MATDDTEAWPPAEVLEVVNHERTFAELVPAGVVVADDTDAFVAAIGRVEEARRHFEATDFELYEFNTNKFGSVLLKYAEATVRVELPLPDGKAGWTGSGLLVQIPADKCKLIGKRDPGGWFDSLAKHGTDVLAVWTNWHVAHYPEDATVDVHGMTAEHRGSAGLNMTVVMDYAVGRKPVRLSAGGTFPAFLLFLFATLFNRVSPCGLFRRGRRGNRVFFSDCRRRGIRFRAGAHPPAPRTKF